MILITNSENTITNKMVKTILGIKLVNFHLRAIQDTFVSVILTMSKTQQFKIYFLSKIVRIQVQTNVK